MNRGAFGFQVVEKMRDREAARARNKRFLERHPGYKLQNSRRYKHRKRAAAAGLTMAELGSTMKAKCQRAGCQNEIEFRLGWRCPRFCSEKCAKQVWSLKHKEEMNRRRKARRCQSRQRYTKKCQAKGCDKEFETHRLLQIYCCLKCRRSDSSQRNRLKNRDVILERQRRMTPAQRRVYRVRSYAKHREKILARAREYARLHPEVLAATRKKHYAANIDKCREQVHRSYLKHRDKRRTAARRRLQLRRVDRDLEFRQKVLQEFSK